MIADFLVYKGETLLSVEYLNVEEFVALLNAFQVKKCDAVKVIPLKMLHSRGSLPLLKKSGNFYIIERNYCHKNIWTIML